jgi:hypothetical protein
MDRVVHRTDTSGQALCGAANGTAVAFSTVAGSVQLGSVPCLGLAGMDRP